MSPKEQKIAQSTEFNYSQLLDIQGTVHRTVHRIFWSHPIHGTKETNHY